VQGAGLAGIGALIDREGRDQYACFYEGQGFGAVKGFGLLLDALGDDTYTAHPMPIEFPSPQTAERNVSMAQGAGYGRRADYSDGRSWAGGIGVLIDVQGNDRYLCGVFGQGVGYWGGVGMLIDPARRRRARGHLVCAGAAAHFAIGYLEDRLGNDRTLAAMNMAIGAGHDFSIGYYIDFRGQRRIQRAQPRARRRKRERNRRLRRPRGRRPLSSAKQGGQLRQGEPHRQRHAA
jgi:hypothetical protein